MKPNLLLIWQQNKKIILISGTAILLALVAINFILNRPSKNTEIAKIAPLDVSVQSLAISHEATTHLDFPATVVSESEAKIIAKASGNANAVNFKVGDKVTAGQILFTINDVSDHNYGGGFNAAQVQQAALSVSQAQTNYELARLSYNNMLESSAKDLKAAEIGRDQALSGQGNLNITTGEAIKSAQIAYDTAKLSTAQAKNNLDLKGQLVNQSTKDLQENSYTAADSAASTAGTILSNINAGAALDENNAVTISYQNQLGALDASIYSHTKDTYKQTKTLYQQYLNNKFQTANEHVEAAYKLSQSIKNLAQEYKQLLDSSVSSAQLSQATLTGLQAAAGAYISQSDANLAQLSLARQGLNNSGLNNQSILDGLSKAYELAQNQEASAQQALKNLQAGNKSQLDQAGFSGAAANNNFQNLKIKINTQLAAAKSQMDMAQIQYQNAQVALQSLYDSRQVISPIDGFITKKSVISGDYVNLGQLVATVSQTSNSKVQFFVDQEVASLIMVGQNAQIKTNDKNLEGLIMAVSPAADPITKRFLIEVKPSNAKAEDLPLGTIVTASLTVKRGNIAAGNQIILPLSAINIGQNGNYIFIADNNIAKQVSVAVGEVSGEFATVTTDLSQQTLIIIDGTKLLSDGQSINIK